MSSPRAEATRGRAPPSLSWEAAEVRRHNVGNESVLTAQRRRAGRARDQPPGALPGGVPRSVVNQRVLPRSYRPARFAYLDTVRSLEATGAAGPRPSTPLHRRLERTTGDGSPARVGGWRPAPPREDEGLAPPPARADTTRVPRPPWAAAEIRASPPSWPWPRESSARTPTAARASPPWARRAGAPARCGT